MAKWQMGIIAVFVVVYCIVVTVTGNPEWIWPGLILAGLVLMYSALNLWISRRAIHHRNDGDRGKAMGDHEFAFPASHLIPDDETGAGDTPEVHAEVNVHDFPLYSPVRHTVLELTRSPAGTTRGQRSGAAGGPELEGGEDRTAERTGEPQTSAGYTPTA